MKTHTHQVVVEAPEKHQPGVWSKVGGEALTFAVVFHVAFGDSGGGDRGVQTASLNKKHNPITPSNDIKRVVAEGALSNLAAIHQGIDLGELEVLKSLPGGGGPAGMGGSGLGSGFGQGDSSGIGNRWGGPKAAGKIFGPVPLDLSKRCSVDDRRQRILNNGGTLACEDAVLKGLRWLKTQQQADGSWGDQNKPAMTGLALLAYLGHCETVASPEFGESVAKGLVYLIDLGMKNDGKLGTDFNGQPFCYEHAIATYALAEAATAALCTGSKWPFLPHLNEVTRKAGQFIIDNQNKNGGWAYQYAIDGGHTDLSIVGWQVQALKACSHVPNAKFKGMDGSISQALNYVNSLQGPSGSYGYAGPGGGGYQPLTGVGMLCNQMWDKGKSPHVIRAAKSVLAHTTFNFKTGAHLYAAYYESQAAVTNGQNITSWSVISWSITNRRMVHGDFPPEPPM
ncbi:MAG: hypothetical protein NTV46_13225 [Verrucomicrobia bacterium]|nr:hypothetical protein [Verrucomicrobiota bacterium]